MTSWLEFLVEELSMEAALRTLVPKLRPDLSEAFRVHPFNGKDNLLAQLPRRLDGYSRWLPRDAKVVIVVDKDDDDCRELKSRLEHMAAVAGLEPKRGTSRGRFAVLVRLAIEELEAWYLGDSEALVAAYPRLPAALGRKARFREPDRVKNPWRALERELQRAGYFRAGLAKIELARSVAAHMRPEVNASASFRAFKEGVQAL
jgi:hypothetical protein